MGRHWVRRLALFLAAYSSLVTLACHTSGERLVPSAPPGAPNARPADPADPNYVSPSQPQAVPKVDKKQ